MVLNIYKCIQKHSVFSFVIKFIILYKYISNFNKQLLESALDSDKWKYRSSIICFSKYLLPALQLGFHNVND